MKNILLTGEPRCGKTTLLKQLLSEIEMPKRGFLTEEMVEQGFRTGFQIVSSEFQILTLARLDMSSPLRVGRYGVDSNATDLAVAKLGVKSGGLLYVDEIGQMQLFSRQFRAWLMQYLNSRTRVLGTITSVYSDDLTRDIQSRNDVRIFRVNQLNQKEVKSQVLRLLVP